MAYIDNVWVVLSELAFWLLVGCFVSGVLHALVPDHWLKKHLGGGGSWSVLKAVFIGVPMPLCSCGVIPAALGLKKQGAGDGASMGFMISTPQTGIDSIFVSASMLSWPFAIFKLQERGSMFIGPQTKVYQGMIVGQNNRDNDLDINLIKGKALTNMRASGSDKAVILTTPKLMSLEEIMAYIKDDELIEVTPQNLRLRKKFLCPNERKRNSKNI